MFTNPVHLEVPASRKLAWPDGEQLTEETFS
jgi:hypothetical protein